MSDVFFAQLDIPRPDHHLGIASLSHGAMTGRMLEAIGSALILSECRFSSPVSLYVEPTVWETP
ncbi:hypothetical protein [uncultured Thiodictyon sp.]|uniref:hypothetical protein n=1 Tax=uncultured Thiodictyon sp. TaxID=1846217 RepID=UPI0025DE5FCD|nr:hypothetical protein [uncultured Thiodictyon sp.]